MSTKSAPKEIPLGTKRYSVVIWQESSGGRYFCYVIVAYRRDRFKRSHRIGWRKLGFECVDLKANPKFIDRKDALNAGRAEVEQLKARNAK